MGRQVRAGAPPATDTALPAPAGGEDALRITLLGGFRAARGGRAIPEGSWRLQKAKSLVKLLALAPGHQLGREEIADRLWPHLDPQAASNNFHRTLHAARRALAAGDTGRGAGPLTLRAGRVALHPGGALWVDLAAFEAAAAVARRAGTVAAYGAALALYGGELLPEDRYEDWAAGRRELVRETFLGLLLNFARLHEARGDWAAGIAALERLVATDPAHEEGYIGLMRLHARAGERTAALRQWSRLREALRDDLDAEPGPAARRLHAEILAGRFPPPGIPLPASPAPTPRRTNLPAPLTSFIDRAGALAEVQARLRDTRLLTLTGTGGCGKTRLALAVAAALVEAGRYPDGVWLVELAALTDPALVPGAIASALGTPLAGGGPPLDTLAEALREQTLLLVLDNCEHLVEGCATVARRLLAAAPQLHILATSRVALRVWGEHTWAVPPLKLPDAGATASPDAALAGEAVALFIDRVRWRRPGFALTADNVAAVVAVCQRLEGLPLALELAAARAAVLSPAQLAARLDDTLTLLAAGDRAAPPRQRTLRATLDWSHRLLTAEEQVLFRRLAIFAGGWSLDAAEAVCADDTLPGTAILVLLAALVEQSLVHVENSADGREVRYRLLEPVRQYAGQHLAASGESDALAARHAAHFLALAERVEPLLAGPEQVTWLDHLGGDYGNLRVALEWAASAGEPTFALRLGGALWRFWSVRGPVGEGRDWLARLLAHAGSRGDLRIRAKALASAGLLAHQQGDHAAARPLFEEAVALRRALGDPAGLARALTNLAFVVVDTALASQLLSEALIQGQAANDRMGILRTLNSLGEMARETGDYARAIDLYGQSLALCRDVGERLGSAHVLHNLGLALLALGQLDPAAGRLRESLALCRELGDRGLAGRVLLALAAHAAASGASCRAARLAGASQAARAATGMDEGALNREGTRRYLDAARSALGAAAFAAAERAGGALTLDEAIAEALTDVATVPDMTP